MRVLVCGGRNYEDKERVFRELDRRHDYEQITLIMHGACCNRDGNLRGADKWAEMWAISREVNYCGVPAKWSADGRKAGPQRNQRMLDNSPDLVLAFPGGAGTADIIRRADKATCIALERVQ